MDNLALLIGNIANNIEKYRTKEDKKIPLETISRNADVTLNTIIKLKTKRAESVSLPTLVGIARALECSVVDLLQQ